MEAGGNPRDAKMALARELTARFHGESDAKQAAENFSRCHQHGQTPDDMPEVTLDGPEEGIPLGELVRRAGLATTNAEAMRLISQGAVRLDGERISDRTLAVPPGTTIVLQVGKRRFARVTVTTGSASSQR